jgi:hypothetical protein
MFHTSIPFGYTVIYLVLLGSIVTGGLSLLVGYWKRIRTLKRLGMLLVTIGVGLLAADTYYDSLMEWNPHIASDAAVFGTWADDRETITLHADQRVDYHSWNEGFSGTWSRFDWNLRLQAVDVDSEMRFVRYDGELRLMTNPPNDPDQWNGVIGLRKVLEKGEK